MLRNLSARAARFAAVICVLCTMGDDGVRAQTYDYWRPMLHSEALMDSLPGTVRHFSSYDRRGGNSDLGYYCGTDQHGWKILCDVTGPGVLQEFWWTRENPNANWQIRVYIGDTLTPILDVPLNDFCGSVAPFVPPLADSVSGGNFNYVPIPFASRLRLTYSGQTAIYYHATVLSLTAGTQIESFTMPPSGEFLARRDSLAARFANPAMPVYDGEPYLVESGSATIATNETQTLVNYVGCGVSRTLYVLAASHAQSTLENMWVRVYTDHYPSPDLEGPVSTLFGAALGWRPYRSAVTGMLSDSIYLNLPVPFRSHLRVDVTNLTGSAQAVEVVTEIVEVPAAMQGRFKLSSQYCEENPTITWGGYDVAGWTTGGNYVGMLLDMQAIATNNVLEGDEALWFDNESTASWLGTGTEDYFNGGYYWTDNGGDVVESQLGFHGCIRFGGGTAAAYRWHLSDPLPFRTDFKMRFDVGPWNELYGHYRSIAFAYVRPEPWVLSDVSDDGRSCPNEPLRIVGRGCTPWAAITDVQMGSHSLAHLAGDLSADADSVVDVTFAAPGGAASGNYPVIIFVNGQPHEVNANWPHDAQPRVECRLLRAEQDEFVFGGDTLEIDVHGVPVGQPAVVQADGMALPWVGEGPVANECGVVSGLVTIPLDLGAADHELTAVSDGIVPAQCEEPLKVRYYCRYEVEAMPRTAWQGSQDKTFYVLDFTFAGSNEPWGRNLARRLSGSQVGNYITVAYNFPQTGLYRLVYFLGRTGRGVITRIRVDDQTDIESYDTYSPTADWRWTRSDSLRGQWRELTAGVHTVTFEIAGRNPANTTHWDLVMDQILIHNPLDTLDVCLSANVLPEQFELSACYPNPFNPATTFTINVPQAADVTIVAYDVLGRQAATLVEGRLAAGKHVIQWDASAAPSGVYFVEMTARDFRAVRKSVLIR